MSNPTDFPMNVQVGDTPIWICKYMSYVDGSVSWFVYDEQYQKASGLMRDKNNAENMANLWVEKYHSK